MPVEQYSPFTQTAVKLWRRLWEHRQLGSASVPWVGIWFAVTGALLGIAAGGGKGLAQGLAGTLLLSALLLSTVEHA